MQDIIDQESEDNFEAFKNKLNVNKLHKEVYAFYKDHEKFANEMDTILLEKKGKLDNAINTLEDKLEQWKKVRKWENEISRSLLKQPDELDRLLKKLCHEETTRDFYKGPRGKSLQMLDMSKEYCKNLLNAGQSLATVWKTIDLEMSKEKINTSTIPKPEFLAITK
jgi:predicted RNase H-like nuclease (RuvC/YqgF family)